MTAAAKACYVSPAAVSVGINELERVLGVGLLHRRQGHGVTLTEIGERVVRDGREVLGKADELQENARAEAAGVTGTLRLGCFVTLAPFYFSHLRAEFATRYPGVGIEVFEADQPHLDKMLREGEVEIAITYDSGLSADFRCQPIRSLSGYVLLAAGHPLAAGQSVDTHELAEYDLVLLDVPPSPENAMRVLAAAGVVPPATHRSKNIEVVRSLVARSTAYTMLVQRWPSNVSLDGKPLVCRPLAGWGEEQVRVVIAWPDTRRLSGRATAFIEVAEDVGRWDERPVDAETQDAVLSDQSGTRRTSEQLR